MRKRTAYDREAELYGFTMDYLIHREKEEGQSPGMKELFVANLEKLPPEKQNYCLQMLFLFVEGTAAGTRPAAGEKERG